jgi:hypothetical protein
MKLVRVNSRRFRNEAGTVHVTRAGRPELPWSVRFTDGIGCKIQRRLDTFDDCARYLAERFPRGIVH